MKEEMSVKEDKAKEFLNNLKRQKRQLWDRSQPDVQQWYQHFLYLGFDEAVSGIVVLTFNNVVQWSELDYVIKNIHKIDDVIHKAE